MPIITRIAPQKGGSRVNIYVDEEFAFSTDLETLVVKKIKVGVELTAEEVAKLKATSAYTYKLFRLIAFCSLRPRSLREVDSWLTKKKIAQVESQKLKDRITQLKLVDDLTFAQWWVDQRREFRPMGVHRLRFELKNKGVTRDIIDKVLEHGGNDQNDATALLNKKYARVSANVREKDKMKMVAFLVRRGFGFEIAKRAVDELLANLLK